MDSARVLQRAAEANLAGRHPRAIDLCTLALNSEPTPELVSALCLERAVARVAISDFAAAEHDCRRILNVSANTRVFALIARCYFELQRMDSAVKAIEVAVAEEPNCADHWQLYFEALLKLRRHDEALQAAERVYGCRRDLAAFKLIIRALANSGRHAELVERVDLELKDVERDADVWTALGYSHNALGQSEMAIVTFERALMISPERHDARCGLGYARLRLGDYTQGLIEHEHRQERAGNVARLGVRPWRGETLSQKHLLIRTEQGMGDIIQFVRFVPLVRQLAGQTTLHAPKVITRLLSRSTELGVITSDHPGFGSADYQTLLMSLPHYLKLGANIGIVSVPYLSAEPEMLELWRSRLPKGPKLALAWQGSPHFGGEPWRSIPLARMGPLVKLCLRHELPLLSLQKNFGREQLASCEFGRNIIDLGGEIDSHGDAFVDTVAILANVDLFITTDTSLAHLAGAAGIRTWLLLSHVADWRWGTHSQRTLWYPNMRLFRQPSGGDWDSVIGEVTNAMRSEWIGIAKRSESPPFR